LLVVRAVTVSTFLTLVSAVHAEDGDGHRVEIGPELVDVRLGSLGEGFGGFGAVGSYYVVPGVIALAIDGHVSHCSDDLYHVRTLTQVGVKAGILTNTGGLFAKIRPGLASFRQQTATRFSDPGGLSDPFYRFSIDLGGTVQWYARDPMMVRFDFGANLIPFGGVTYDTGQGPPHRLGLTANRQFCLAILFGF